jgi:hypothetical protein
MESSLGDTRMQESAKELRRQEKSYKSLVAGVVIQALIDHQKKIKDLQFEIVRIPKPKSKKKRRLKCLQKSGGKAKKRPYQKPKYKITRVRTWGEAAIKAMDEEPAQWLLSDNQEPFSFLWCCSILDINPDFILVKMNKPRLLKELRDIVSHAFLRRIEH